MEALLLVVREFEAFLTVMASPPTAVVAALVTHLPDEGAAPHILQELWCRFRASVPPGFRQCRGAQHYISSLRHHFLGPHFRGTLDCPRFRELVAQQVIHGFCIPLYPPSEVQSLEKQHHNNSKPFFFTVISCIIIISGSSTV